MEDIANALHYDNWYFYNMLSNVQKSDLQAVDCREPYYHVSDVKQSGNVSNDPITNPLHFFTSGGPEKLEDSCKCI